jgi:hypothetical protein
MLVDDGWALTSVLEPSFDSPENGNYQKLDAIGISTVIVPPIRGWYYLADYLALPRRGRGWYYLADYLAFELLIQEQVRELMLSGWLTFCGQ